MRTPWCHRRVASGARNEEMEGILLDVDEAVEVMDRHDIERIKDAQKHVEHELAGRADFRSSYVSKASSVASAAKGKKKKLTKKLVLPHHIAQGDAKAFIPPGSSVWRDMSRGGCCAHLPPHARISESSEKHGGSSDVAFRTLLIRMWVQFADKVGSPPRDVCTGEGLFLVAAPS